MGDCLLSNFGLAKLHFDRSNIIRLLPNIVTEAHANLKKKKTSCNTALKHYAVMVKYTPLERSSLISCLIC